MSDRYAERVAHRNKLAAQLPPVIETRRRTCECCDTRPAEFWHQERHPVRGSVEKVALCGPCARGTAEAHAQVQAGPSGLRPALSCCNACGTAVFVCQQGQHAIDCHRRYVERKEREGADAPAPPPSPTKYLGRIDLATEERLAHDAGC